MVAVIDCVEETLIQEQGRREKNAYIGTCTDCGLEDSLPVSNSQELPDVGDIVEKYICDCGNIAWEVVGYDRLVFELRSGPIRPDPQLCRRRFSLDSKKCPSRISHSVVS